MENITVFGDSVLKGVILENNKYKVLKNRFTNICEDIYGIKITNKAKFGSTVTTGKNSIEKSMDLIKENSSKYVVMEFGGNDCDYNWKEISENPYKKYEPNSTIIDFANVYSELINKIKDIKKVPVLLSLPPIDSKKYLNQISKGLNKNNIIKWLNNDIQFLSNWHERYNLETFKLALNNNISIIDITSIFLEKRNYTEYLCKDGIHPNTKGHELIAKAIKNHIENKNIVFN